MQSDGHFVPSTKAPAMLQVCGVLTLHWCAPGGHMPVQAPVLQTKGQAAPLLPQWPAVSHLCGCRALHCSAPGVQSPHVPGPKQTPGHAVPLCQCPVASQVWGNLPLH